MSEGDKREDLRSRVLRATLQLIGREGLAGVTNRSVARAARVSLGTLTYHFDSQRTLLREALDLFLDEETARLSTLTEQLASAPVTVEDAARALEAILETEPERRAAKMELYLQASRDPQLREAARRCFAAYERLATAALEALEIADAAQIAPVVVATIDGLQLRRLASGERRLQIPAALQPVLAALREQR
jgi:DNA-binding transcriptional regulator YbjK